MVAAIDARVERHLLVAADRAHLALLQHAQQLDLHLERHLADLVEEDRAGAGLDEQAGARPLGVGERAAHVAEQLALEQRRRHRGAVDGDERLIAARRQVVKRARDELLAGAALAGDRARSRRCRRRGGPSRSVSRIAGLVPAMPSIGDVAIGGRAQPLDLAAQRQVLDRAADRDRERVDLHRLGDEVVRAGADRGDRGVEPTLAGEHDRQQIGMALAQLLAQLDARHAGHLDVGHDDIRRHRAQVLERRLAGGHGIDVEAALAQAVAQQHRGVVVVVDDQDGSVHVGHFSLIPF